MHPGYSWDRQSNSESHPRNIIFGADRGGSEPKLFSSSREMENWKIQLVVVTFCALLQTDQVLSSSVDEDGGLSRDWQDESLETDLTQPMATLMKRSKALRFYGLMGKRSGTKKPFQVNRRNKGEMFVGLMGRSTSSSESFTRINPSATTTGIDVSEKPHEQGSSEEWVQILY